MEFRKDPNDNRDDINSLPQKVGAYSDLLIALSSLAFLACFKLIKWKSKSHRKNLKTYLQTRKLAIPKNEFAY